MTTRTRSNHDQLDCDHRHNADERASGPSVGIRASPSVRVGGSRSNAAAFTTSR
jgi:hypothetical protein